MAFSNQISFQFRWISHFLGIVFLIFYSWTPSVGQAFSLRTYSVDAGLAQSQVYASLADSRGFLWFGTRGGGVSIFDGITFKTLNEQEGLLSNYINCLYEDSRNKVWIGTDAGVSCYDGQNYLHYSGGNGLVNETVLAIMEDDQGDIWFGTNAGISILDHESGKLRQVGKAEGLVHNVVTALERDRQGNIWIGTFGGLNVLPAGKSFLRSNLKRFDRYHGLPDSHIRDVFQDSRDKVWICTYGGGVVTFDPSGSDLERQRPFRYLGSAEGLRDGIVFCASEDLEGNIWLGTLNGGAHRYDGKSFVYYSQDEGLYSNHVRSIVTDEWGNTWIGTSGGGVSCFSGDQFVHFFEKKGMRGNRVYSVAEDLEGRLWFGTSGGGVARYDGLVFTHYGQSEGFTDLIVKASFLDSKGNLWFGTEGGGAIRYDGKSTRKYGRNDGLSGNWVKDILEDAKGRIWFATAGGGISVLESGTFKRYGTGDGLPSSRVNCLVLDHKGTLWAGTADRGIARFNGVSFTSFKEENGLCSNNIRSAVLDEEGTIWWGTASGLSKMKINGETPGFECVTKDEGLTSENIYLTIFDNAGNLWSGTERGVDKLVLNRDGNIREVRQYGAPEGFTGIETCQRAALKDRKGNIWFGTINGITRHNPRENERNKLAPRTHITRVNLFYEEIPGREYADSLTDWWGLPMGLELPYNKNHLGFEFIGINHKNPFKVLYKWKLEGNEAEWTPMNGRREATYSNLAPGDYTFRLKAYNEDGVGIKEPVEFSFRILPPWWATWWFRGSAGALLIFTVAAAFRLRIRQIRKENEAVNRKVKMEKEMLELEQKALRLQMNPHFIFNALNSIKGCMAANEIPAARKYLVKFAQLMRLILDNSREPMISVETELKTLQLYLDLEKLSKSDKFNYEFEVDPDIRPEHVGIPPMIIQPFVENAVIHGVAPLKSGGLIRVHFQKEEGKLLCTVTDNGIGREAATERKKSRDGVHKSKGITVTEERLSLLNPNGPSDYRITFIDLRDEKGNPSGTKVEIILPLEEI